jgi:hypothetical protein
MEREAVYELVWSEPISKLAPRYGLSDVGLAKMCRRADIPLPPRGYWAKMAAGKRAARTPLPARGPGKTNFVPVGKREALAEVDLDDAEVDRAPEPEPTGPPQFPDDLTERTEAARALIKRVSVVPLSRKTHPVIQAVLEREEKRIRMQRPGGWSFGESSPLSSPRERRRLRLLNGLFLALDRAGAQPRVSGERASEVWVRVGDTDVPLMLDSPTAFARRRRVAGPRELELRIASPHSPDRTRGTWDETKSPLDAHLLDIAVAVVVAGETLRREAEEARYQMQVELREWRIAEERRRQEEAERARIQRLVQETGAFRLAADIRAYVSAAIAAGCGRGGDELANWATWALATADRLDPARSGMSVNLSWVTAPEGLSRPRFRTSG